MTRGALLPLLAAALALAGSLAATFWLHAAASQAVGRVLEERLEGAGRSAAVLLAGAAPDGPLLSALAQANGLEGALLVDRDLRVLADAAGAPGRRVDLLRVDAGRVQRALGGAASSGFAYHVGSVPVGAAYFPVPGGGGEVASVLVLEAGAEFARPLALVDRARWVAAALSLVGALALAALVARWARAERLRQAAAARAAHGEALARLAAVAAHEVRNPLGIIRGTVERMQARGGPSARDGEALADILGEVERLRLLTEDLLDLSADRPLVQAEVELQALAEEVARAVEAAHPGVAVAVSGGGPAVVRGDPGRLRQVLLNLLQNAAQAQGQGEVRLRLSAQGSQWCLRVEDDGPGLGPEVRARLFEAFVSDKTRGTGLGLAVSRRLVARHGGTLSLAPSACGAAFEVRLPRAD